MLKTVPVFLLTVALMFAGTPATAATVEPSPTPTTPTPLFESTPNFGITGSFRDGGVITVNNDGWSPTPTNVQYEWAANGTVFSTTTTNSITLTANHVGKTITTKIIATLDEQTETFTSAATIPIWPGKTSEQELRNKIIALSSSLPGVYSVTVREVNGGMRAAGYSNTTQMDPASIMKLFYAYAAYKKMDAGQWTTSTRLASGVTVGACLKAMIEVSDNPCAVDIRQAYGHTNFNRLMASAGFTNTRIITTSTGAYSTKRTSTNDVSILLRNLEQGTLLKANTTAHFKNLLFGQIWRMRISSSLPAGVKAGTKSGQLWVAGGMIEADAGIVYGPKTTYVVSIISQPGATTAGVRAMSQMIYRYLQGDNRTAKVYPKTQMTTASTIALRRSPGGSIIRNIGAGNNVEVLASSRAWYQIKVAGITGWVPQSSLKLSSSYRW